MPEIAEAAVFGVPDAQWGEVGVAVLALRVPGAGLPAADVLSHLEPRLARYKWPRHIEFWPALPKSAYGKLVKKDLRTEYLRRHEAPAGEAAAGAAP